MQIQAPDDDFLPYAQMPGEKGQHWDLFVRYRDMGPRRRVSDVAKMVDLDGVWVRQIAKNHEWKARAQAWDAEVDRVRRHTTLEQQRVVLDAHRALAEAMREKAAHAVANTTELTAADVVRWVETATRIEQQAYTLRPDATAEPTKDATSVYFDTLPTGQLRLLGVEALAALEREEEMPK